MKRFTQKQKDDLVQGYLQSEIPCTEYCKQHDLHPNTLYRWKKQYETKPGEQGSFVEITPAESVLSGNKQNTYIEIRTKNARIQIPVTIGNEQIAYLFDLMGLAHVS
ncbi:MAG TPA: transposase [Treponemataceae bacterium]|jgi:transposase-like protein|nr:MAG: Transposase [Spirochaetes bacterium ADurb.Bin215]HOF84607.1 transposase [Treponemataceae bacterium]HOS34495.1 transposase [Treponemataceae bacterium]HPA10637.1 transposase [Treponemataceae bacterium]HQF74544.1 transposase [Treponemataceae bacterium]